MMDNESIISFFVLDYFFFILTTILLFIALEFMINRKVRKIWINFESLKKINRRRLRFGAILMLLAVYSSGYYFVENETDKKIAYIQDIIIAFAPVLSEELQEEFHDKEASPPAETVIIDKLKLKLTKLTKYNSQINAIYTVRKSTNGRFEYTISSDNVANRLEIERELLRNHSDLEKSFLGNVVFEKKVFNLNWGKSVSMFCPIYDENNVQDGVLVVDFNASILESEIFDARIRIILELLIAIIIIYISYWNLYISKIENEIIKISHKKLEDFATKDSLTKTFNRYKFEELFKIEIERASRYKHPLSLIMFDVDNFKQINDSFGHQAGDGVLKHVTTVVKTVIRNNDVFARWGGDEFLIGFPETKADDVYKIAEKIRTAVYEHDFGFGKHFSVSIGIAEYKLNEEYETFMKRADEALYLSKVNKNTTSLVE